MLKTEGRVVAARLSEAVAGSKKRRERARARRESKANSQFWHHRRLQCARTLRLHTVDLTWKDMVQLPTSNFLLAPNKTIQLFLYLFCSLVSFDNSAAGAKASFRLASRKLMDVPRR